MTRWAIVPVNARRLCKTRLAGVLPDDARLALVRDMLAHVLSVLGSVATLDRVVVVSPERDLIPDAIQVFADAGDGLNAALRSALTEVSRQGATRAVIVPSDLPLVAPADIEALIAAAASTGLALAPDAAGTGTNAVALTLPSRFEPSFGPNSFARHAAQAPHAVLDRPGLADLDLPADLLKYRFQSQGFDGAQGQRPWPLA